MLHGVAGAVEHRSIPFDVPFRTVIDVGAHTGQFALFALDAFPSARIICFEPLADAQRRLRTATASDPRVQLFGVAAGSASDECTLHVTRSTDSSSLLPVSPRLPAVFPRTEEVRRETVAVVPLDIALQGETVARPCLLKIDVQGNELDVLKGASGMLDSIDQIVVECSFMELYLGQPLAGDIVCHLLERDFEFVGLYNPAYDQTNRPKRLLQADLLFSRPTGSAVTGRL
jgi:FkbM family methyltransferase